MAAKRKPNFNERMAAARHGAGLSLNDVAFELRRLLPKAMWASANKLNRLERSTPEARADPILVVVLADIYDVGIADLSPLVADELGRLSDVLSSQLLIGGPPRGGSPYSGWTTEDETTAVAA